MPSSSSPSPDHFDALLQRFLAVSRRAEIVALVNSARSQGDLGSAVASELCEAYDAEIGFVLVARADPAAAELVGSVGLTGDDPMTILDDPLCGQALASAVAVSRRGTDLLGLGIRNVALAAGTAGGARLLVGVGRLYEQDFDEMELALLEAVTKSTAHALERFDLERQLQCAHDTEAVAPLAADTAPELTHTLATILGHCDLALASLHRGSVEVETELIKIRTAAASATELVQRLSRPAVRADTLDLDVIESHAPADLHLPVLSDLAALAHLFRHLAHPVRLRILLALGGDTLSPSDLQQRLDVGLGLVAYHVRTLRDDGLVMLVDTRATRGSLESFYRLTARGDLARNVLAATEREISDIAKHA